MKTSNFYTDALGSDWFDQQEDRTIQRRRPPISGKHTQSIGSKRKWVKCENLIENRINGGYKFCYPKKMAIRQLKKDHKLGLDTKTKYKCKSCDCFHLTKMTKEEYQHMLSLRH